MNPLEQVKSAIKSYVTAHWDALGVADKAFVRPGNRWDRDDRKNLRAAADTPAVDILPVGPNSTQPFATSSSGLFTRSYELGIATDGLTAEEGYIDRLEWELVRAAAKMQADKLGLPSLVTTVAVASTNQTNQDREAGRGKKTWTGAVVLTVQFQVSRSDIVPAA